jgi:hypothetical protein
MEDRWVKLGVVGVDSGQLMVCDPCYIDGEWREEEFNPGCAAKENFSYNRVCEVTQANALHGGQLKFKKGHAGVAVAFTSGVGDGLYAVQARIGEIEGWGERVKEVRIIME